MKVAVVYVYEDSDGVPRLDETDKYHALKLPYDAIERAEDVAQPYRWIDGFKAGQADAIKRVREHMGAQFEPWGLNTIDLGDE